uniref:Uncharacterized protein n=1 Tax=Panagrolaimus sp. JU765 TaxID=591449 RepID=A0AC34QKR0_9BILA
MVPKERKQLPEFFEKKSTEREELLQMVEDQRQRIEDVQRQIMDLIEELNRLRDEQKIRERADRTEK